MEVTKEKNCYCFTCDKDFHYLGIARHISMHRSKKEACKVMYTNDNIREFSDTKSNSIAETPRSGKER